MSDETRTVTNDLQEALRLAEWRAKDHDDLATAYNLLTDAIRKALAALPTSTEGLDAAWAEAEAALPVGWILEVGDWRAEPNRPEGIAPFEAVAQPYVRQHDGNDPMVIGRSHEGPAAALRALAASLSPSPTEDPAR